MNRNEQHPRSARPGRPRTRRPLTTTLALLLAAAGVAAGTTACSGDATPPPVVGGQSAPAVAPTSVESVSPQLAAARAAASASLKSVKGRGNAVGDVQLSGVDEATAHGHPAATVKITNHTAQAASYAVQVDFADGAGTVVESAVTALDDLGPGQTATLLTFGSKATQAGTTAKVAKAERH
ncbi:hypothetical protein [Peterkaempfera sp. SMS 1(5)a]|uniref:hypothetical protein n=1 Tax=Peterkaempfera podocarpi TaxID=3232308 RepID=UPI0036724C13